jgi:hypothetical protein
MLVGLTVALWLGLFQLESKIAGKFFTLPCLIRVE